MIIRTAVTCSDFKKSTQILLKTVTDAMAMKFSIFYCTSTVLKDI